MTGKSLLSAGALVAVGMVAGRAIGLLREMLIAAHFGASGDAGIAIALLIIPDFIAGALLSGAAAATLIPAFAARREEATLPLLWQALLAAVIAALFIALILDGLIVSGVHEEASAFIIVFTALPLTAATWVITAWLQYRQRFLIPAFANAIFNSAVVLALCLSTQLVVLACGILLAAALRLIAHLVSFFMNGGYLPHMPFSPWQLRQRLLSSYAATAGAGIAGMLPQYAPYAVMAAAGGIAIYNYAFKLVMLPAMLLQTVVQMVLLPWFVSLRQEHHEPRQEIHAAALQIGWLISLCLCLTLSLAAHPLAQLCFGYGRMTPENVNAVAAAFAAGVWAVPGMVLTMLWQQILYAHEHTGAPLMASLLQSFLIIPFCWLGARLAGTPGVLLGFALVQTLPLLLLAHQGTQRGMVAHHWPSRITLIMSAVSLLVFLPFAALLSLWPLPPLPVIILAGLLGMAALAGGIAANPPLRQWAVERIRHL